MLVSMSPLQPQVSVVVHPPQILEMFAHHSTQWLPEWSSPTSLTTWPTDPIEAGAQVFLIKSSVEWISSAPEAVNTLTLTQIYNAVFSNHKHPGPSR